MFNSFTDSPESVIRVFSPFERISFALQLSLHLTEIRACLARRLHVEIKNVTFTDHKWPCATRAVDPTLITILFADQNVLLIRTVHSILLA